MRTRITNLMGTRYPIVQGGMQQVGRAELASAVSNAGALGILTALTQPTPDALAAEIARCRTMTDKPFGVNLTILPTINPPPYADYVEAIVASGVRIVETAGRSPAEFIARFKEAGIRIVHKCTSVRHALSAQRAGADAICIDGYEAAGHPGEDDVPGLVLIQAAARALDVPLLAAGGMATGRSMAAALTLGAEGVTMGSRFMLTQEAPVHPGIKAALVAASERDTDLIFRPFRNTARVLHNAVSAEVLARQARSGATFEDVRELVSGARGREALATGQIDAGLVWAGMGVGLMDDVPSCAELVERLVAECREALARAAALTGE